MKNVLYVLVSLVLLISCQSKEEKATALIKEDMFKTLYNFEGYQPIETTIDSAFYSVYTDSTILVRGYLIAELLKEANKIMEKGKDAVQTLKIWGYDSYSSYSQSKIKDAQEKAKKCLEKVELYSNLIKIQSDSIKQFSQKVKPFFCGWKATQKFRCKTKGGNSTIGCYIYYFDKKIEKIVYKEDTEDNDLIKVKALIKEAIEDNEKATKS